MTNIISMATAARVWSAHREIETGKKLLAEIEEALREGRDPTPVDPVWRTRRGYQLGVPISDSGHRLLNVSPKLTAHIVRAHIAEKEKELAEACICARIEMEGTDSA